MRPRVQVLLPTWSPFYVSLFTDLCLPAMLAPGNLPALAEKTDLDLVVLTRDEDQPLFERAPSFKSLRELCPVRFIDVSDLVVEGLYGFTLTFGYLRAIRAMGAEAKRTHFLFMVGDCVVADGSFRSLLPHLEAGRSMVMGGNLRAVYEDASPELRARVDPASGVLAVPPRELVATTLRHVHPTVLGRVLDQDVCHVVQPNFLLWKVDERTLLAHFFSMHMLCIRPERSDFRIDGYCDYAFVPEMCPSGDTVFLRDSDAFFMLELQRREHEEFFLRLGRANIDALASALHWTTREHRAGRVHPFVFHAGDVPATLAAVEESARAVVEGINARLGPPAPHNGHPFWSGNLERFERLRPGGRAAEPPAGSAASAASGPPGGPVARGGVAATLRSHAARMRDEARFVLRRARSFLMGRAPHVRPWHPDWLDYQHVLQRLAHLRCELRATERVLHVTANDDPFDRELATISSRVTTRTIAEAVSSGGVESEPFALAFCFVPEPELRANRALIDAVLPQMRLGAPVLIFVREDRSPGRGGALTDALRRHATDLGRIDLRIRSVSFVAGRMRASVRRRVDRRATPPTSSRAWARARRLIEGPWLLAAALIANLVARRSDPDADALAHCSSASFEIEAP